MDEYLIFGPQTIDLDPSVYGDDLTNLIGTCTESRSWK